MDPVTELPGGARALVVTASNRAAAGVYEDRSGQVLAAGLAELGFGVEGPKVLPDDAVEIADVLRAAVEGGGAAAALQAMEQMAVQLEGSVLRGVVGAEEAGRPGAAAGFERRMEQIVHALRNAIAFRSG